MNVLVKRKTSINDSLKQMGKLVVTSNETKYYFLPFWFKDAGTHSLIAVGLDNLPIELLEILNKQRESIIQKQQQNDTNTTGGVLQADDRAHAEDNVQQGS